MPVKKAIVVVTSDLITDQRVHRNCMALQSQGFEVLLVGRKLHNSPEMNERPYEVKRFRLLFEKGPFFYAAYNLRLFFFLMLKRSSLIFSNDLDTLLASWLSSKIKGNRLVYDSHEYYTGVPELENRPLVRGVWKSIERFIFPRLKTVITVNESIAELYKLEYGNNITVIRNVPAGGEKTDFQSSREAVRAELNIPSTTRLIILQGSGINKDRGGEELVRAMAHTQNVKLLIIGGGDVLEELKHICKNEKTDDKVLFLPRMPITQLMRYTAACDLGLTLDKDTNINYRFSLPNKIFDYVRAGVPVLASRLKEVEKIIQQWNIGGFIENHDPKHIGQRIMEFLDDQKLLDSWKKNTQLAASELCWEREVLKFPDLR